MLNLTKEQIDTTIESLSTASNLISLEIGRSFAELRLGNSRDVSYKKIEEAIQERSVIKESLRIFLKLKK